MIGDTDRTGSKLTEVIFKGETATGGIYPHNSVVTYESEILDLFGTFNHQTGLFVVPRDGRYSIGFQFNVVCHQERNPVTLLINGQETIGTACIGDESIQLYGLLFEAAFEQGDKVEIYSGNADIYTVTYPAVFTGSMITDEWDQYNLFSCGNKTFSNKLSHLNKWPWLIQ